MGQQRTAVVTDRVALHSYDREWTALAQQRGNPFLTAEWFWSWLEIYGDTAEPAVLTTRRADGSLLGLLPFVTASTGRLRTVRFAGGTLADRLHPVCRAEDEGTIAAAAAGALAQLGGGWRLAVLENVSVEARWWRALSASTALVGHEAYRNAVLPAIKLETDGWEEYLRARSRNFRDQARRFPRRLEREHHVRYRRTTDQSELERDMTTFFSLHDARWRTRGGSSLTSPRARAFHLEFAHSALQRGWLRLWFLELDGTAVAAWYGWRLGDRYSYYQAGFDPAWEHLSVGFVLLVHTVKSAIEEGAAHYDLLLGDEAYKERFANTREWVCTVTLSHTRQAQILTAVEARLWRASRRLPPQFRSLPGALSTLLPTARRR